MNEIKTNIIKFLFGGNSIFTIVEDSNHKSYKIFKKHTKDGSNVYQLYLRKSNKNIYCGYFKIVDNKLSFRYNNKYGFEEDFNYIKTLQNVIRLRKSLPTNIKILHCGRCACCGRKLTDPKSMETGFGPKCYNKIKLCLGG